MDWLGWVIPTVFTLAISIAAFFIKRSINKKDKEREAKDAKWEQEQRDLKDLIVSELKSFRTENEDRHCKTEAHVQRVEERLNKTLQELPIYYTLRDDWQRSTSSIDRKLDGIQNTLLQIYKGGKQGND